MTIVSQRAFQIQPPRFSPSRRLFPSDTQKGIQKSIIYSSRVFEEYIQASDYVESVQEYLVRYRYLNPIMCDWVYVYDAILTSRIDFRISWPMAFYKH